MGIDLGNFDQPVGIKDPQPPVMEFQDALFAQVAQHSIDVDGGQSSRVTDMLLRQRQVHLIGAVARPLGSVADEQFEDQMCDALARGLPADAYEMVIGQAAVA